MNCYRKWSSLKHLVQRGSYAWTTEKRVALPFLAVPKPSSCLWNVQTGLGLSSLLFIGYWWFLSLRVKRPECEADSSSPSSVKLTSYILFCVAHRNIYLYVVDIYCLQGIFSSILADIRPCIAQHPLNLFTQEEHSPWNNEYKILREFQPKIFENFY